jgi:hypothetical protein
MNRAQRRASRHKRAQQWDCDPTAAFRAVQRVQNFTQAEITKLVMPMHQSWASLCAGTGDGDDFNTLAAAANICMIQAESIDALLVEAISRAQDALIVMRERQRRCGRWGTDHLSREHIPPMLDVFEQLLTLCTPVQMHKAFETVQARVRQGHILEVKSS